MRISTFLAGIGPRRLLLAAVGVLTLAGCQTPRPETGRTLARHEFTQPQMGVPFRIVLYAHDAHAARIAAHAAFARVAALNAILSDYEDDSELTRLSRTAGSGRAVKLGPDLWRVLHRSQQFARRTDGAFDVTIGPLVQQWRRARRQRELPDPPRLTAALQATGHRHLILNARTRTATLNVPNMRLDLGGIAKGYAVDEALRILRAHGITRALVSGGGDLAAAEAPPGRPAWRIEVAPLDAQPGTTRCFVRLRHGALATSGDLFQHVEIAGQRYSHIVDPRTGIGLTDHSLVTVLAPDCTTADALATSVSVLGPEAGLKLIEATPRAAAHIARKPGERVEVLESARFRRFLDADAPAGKP